MMTLRELRQMVEAKQVGTIYHFTRPETIEHLADDDWQKERGGKGAWHMVGLNGHISATRNHQLSQQVPNKRHDFNLSNGYSARIVLDGDKISEKHRIKPVAGLTDNTANIFDHRNTHRVPRSSGEHEEVIDTKGTDFFHVKPYIKQIDFVHNGHEKGHMDDERYAKIAKTLDAHGIKHNLVRHWGNEGKLNENSDSPSPELLIEVKQK